MKLRVKANIRKLGKGLADDHFGREDLVKALKDYILEVLESPTPIDRFKEYIQRTFGKVYHLFEDFELDEEMWSSAIQGLERASLVEEFEVIAPRTACIRRKAATWADFFEDSETSARAKQLLSEGKNYGLITQILKQEGLSTKRVKEDKTPIKKLEPMECKHEVCEKCGKDLDPKKCPWKGKHPRYEGPGGVDAGPAWVQKSVSSGICQKCKTLKPASDEGRLL
jgi:hypothetical protein